MMRKYFAYLDDGVGCYKIAVPAGDRQDVENFCSGNGELIAIKDVTEDFPISLEKVSLALLKANFGQPEIDFICRCLSDCSIAE